MESAKMRRIGPGVLALVMSACGGGEDASPSATLGVPSSPAEARAQRLALRAERFSNLPVSGAVKVGSLPFVAPTQPLSSVAPRLGPDQPALQVPPALPEARGAFRVPGVIAPMPDHSGRYVMRRPDSSTFFTSEGLTFVGHTRDKAWSLRSTLVGARDGALGVEDQLPGRANVLTGGPSTWTMGMPTFGRVVWDEVRPGVDMIAEAAPGGVAYRFVLSTDARVSDVVMRWEGASRVQAVDDGRGVDVETDLGVLRVRGLRAFAVQGNARRELAARHVVRGSEVSFEVDGWDGRTPLVIDPVASWYLAGSQADNPGSIASDSLGNAVVVGATWSSNFPTTTGAYDTTLGGSNDAFVTKISTTGALLWSTFLGGTGGEIGRSVTVDKDGFVLVGGLTDSSDFPVAGGFDLTPGGCGGGCGCTDGFVAKLKAADGGLQWSTFVGGSCNDEGNAIATDASANVYLVGWTFAGTGFPAIGGFDTTANGLDGFAVKMSSTGTLLWGTYLGTSSASSYANAVTVDGSANVFVTGETGVGFPVTTGLSPTAPGGGFLTKLSSTGALLLSTGTTKGYGVAVDSTGNPHVAFSSSVGKFSGSDLSQTWLITLAARGLAVDSSGSIVAVGSTSSTSLPGLSAGFDTTLEGASDGFVSRISPTGTVLWSSLLGGNGTDSVDALALDPSGNALLTGSTTSTNFPGTSAPPSPTGNGDAFVTRLTFLAQGTACTFPADCRTSFCTDGVCCDRACKGSCEACTNAKSGGTTGTCTNIPNGSDPDKECTAQSCAASTVTKAQVCNGSGACRADGTISCGFFPCVGTACATSCASDSNCNANGFCSGTSCVGDLDLGGACDRAGQCKSGFCVDGVCCNTACTGLCQSCSAAKSGGASGTCTPIANGTDPDKECTGQSCTAGTVTKAQLCNGAGACRSDGTIACGLYATCSGINCATTCGGDTDCVATAFCSGTTCTADLDPGASCSRGAQCKSGFCADGVCCNVACTGDCEACTAAKKGSGTDGTCGNVAADTDPKSKCAADPTPNSCAADGMCNGSGACRTYAKLGTACGATTCTSGSISGKTCNGAGTCETATVPCAPYVCGTTTCKATCADDTECSSDAYCTSAKTCAPRLKAGAACGEGRECEKGFCVDGVCCESACTGQCEACNETGTAGKCVPVSGTPRSKRPACAGDPAVCGGACDGSNPSACKLAPVTKSCGSVCTGGRETPSTCDGLGACAMGKSTDCAPYLCADDKSCATSCTTEAQCALGYTCSTGKCVPPVPPKCSDDQTTSTSGAGVVTNCGAYRCDTSTGSCRQACASSPECAAGNVCDLATKTCASAPGETESDSSGGCGCETPRSERGERSSLAALPLALALALAARRRRR